MNKNQKAAKSQKQNLSEASDIPAASAPNASKNESIVMDSLPDVFVDMFYSISIAIEMNAKATLANSFIDSDGGFNQSGFEDAWNFIKSHEDPDSSSEN